MMFSSNGFPELGEPTPTADAVEEFLQEEEEAREARLRAPKGIHWYIQLTPFGDAVDQRIREGRIDPDHPAVPEDSFDPVKGDYRPAPERIKVNPIDLMNAILDGFLRDHRTAGRVSPCHEAVDAAQRWVEDRLCPSCGGDNVEHRVTKRKRMNRRFVRCLDCRHVSLVEADSSES